MAIPEDTERLFMRLETSDDLGATQASMIAESLRHHPNTIFTVFAHAIGATMRQRNTDEIPQELWELFKLTMSIYSPDIFTIPVFPSTKDKFDGEKVII